MSERDCVSNENFKQNPVCVCVEEESNPLTVGRNRLGNDRPSDGDDFRHIVRQLPVAARLFDDVRSIGDLRCRGGHCCAR